MNTNTPLAQLAISALLGVAKKPPDWPVLPGAIGTVINDLNNADAAERLLQTAGILALTTELASEPVPLPPTMVLLMPAPTETLPVANSESIQEIIATVLQYSSVKMQIELLELLIARNLRLPFACLPTLLDMATKNSELRDVVARLPGHRQQWLAQLNPRWCNLKFLHAVPITEQNWEVKLADIDNISFEERVAVLQQLYLTSPDMARQLLANFLKVANASERQILLEVLQAHLTPTDGELLETLLYDRAKTIRQLAARLLSCIPESNFAQRMMARLAAIIRTKYKSSPTKITLIITLPETFDSSWQADGIEDQARPGEGNKAYWLRQLVTLTPLSWWNKYTTRVPDTILDLCKKSDWHQAIINGIYTATIRQGNSVWAQALLTTSSLQSDTIDSSALFQIMPPDVGESILITALAAATNTEAIFDIIQQARQIPTWSVNFGKVLLTGLRKHPYPFAPHHVYHINELAMHLPPPCLAAAIQNWDTSTAQGSTFDKFITCIQLRLRIHQELALL